MTEDSQIEESTERESMQDSNLLDHVPEKRTGEVTITLHRWHLYALVMPLIFVIGLGFGYLLRTLLPLPGSINAAAAADAQPGPEVSVRQGDAESTSASQQVVRYDVPVDDDPILGSENALITIIEFSDYEYPYCRQWHSEVYSQLIDTYGDQIRFVYRDFPLESIHPNANSAAQAANCAHEQGVFWDYHDMLFSNEKGLGSTAYLEYASQLEIDQAAFQECIETNRYQAEVQADFEFAADLGVRSTPTFFINGIAVVGAQPFEIFQQVIDRELAGELP
jgi:protein-disulfide isomerase